MCVWAAWKQLVARDPQARFFYGVATTGVFCKATCASRRPLRSNVRFFLTVSRPRPPDFAPASAAGPLRGAALWALRAAALRSRFVATLRSTSTVQFALRS